MSTKKITKLIFTDFLIPKILRALLLKHITYLAHIKNMSSSQFITAVRTSSVYAKSIYNNTCKDFNHFFLFYKEYILYKPCHGKN